MEFWHPHLISRKSDSTTSITILLPNGPKFLIPSSNQTLSGTHHHTFKYGKNWFLLTYDIQGSVHISSLNIDNNVFTPIELWNQRWSPNFTHFTSYILEGKTYLICYRQSDGGVELYRVDPISADKLVCYEWGKGLTHFLVFEYDGKPYLITYKKGSGMMTIGELSVDSCEEIFSTTWSAEWTDLHVFYYLGEPYIFSYKGGIGTACLDKATPKGFIPVIRKSWDSDWKQFVVFYDKGHPHLFLYKKDQNGKGLYRVEKIFLDQNILTIQGPWEDCNHLCLFYE